MSLHVNIDGSKKILSSVYANINGASRKLTSLYANINGSRKDVLAAKYAWRRYKATSWEQVSCSWNTYYEDVTCSEDRNQTHSVCYGYVTPAYSPWMSYDSFSFSPSTGLFTGLNGEEFDVYTDYDPDTYEITGTDPCDRWIFPYDKNMICKVGSYNMQVFCKTYRPNGSLGSIETMNNGFTVYDCYYAKPTAYSTSYSIVTSKYRHDYPDNGEDYYHSDNGYYDYYGYKYEYIGQI